MSDTFPRWGLKDISFVETDPETIKAQIITEYENASGRSLADGDPVRVFLLTIAERFIHLQNLIDIAAKQNLIAYAQGDHLDALGNVLAVERLQASPAVTIIEFSLSQALGNDFIIVKGTKVTNGIVTFSTDEDLIIKSGDITGSINATCDTAGTMGNNYLVGQINTIVSPKAFLKEAKNTTVTNGGSDVESDESFAERLRLAPNSFSVAGPAKAYRYHALSVSPAIIDVACLSPNAGEVKIYPLLEGGKLPSAELIDQIEAYLSSDTIRPLTDELEVLSPVKRDYKIKVEYWINKEDATKVEAIGEAVNKAVEDYRVWQQTKIGRDITPDELICKVMSAGAARVDFSTLSPNAWQKLEGNEVAQCTEIIINYKGVKDE